MQVANQVEEGRIPDPRRSGIYNRVYQEIYQEVEYFCANNGIAVAMNYDSDKIDTNKPDDVVRMVYRPVVFRVANLDITPRIIDILRSATASSPRQPGPAQPRTTRA